VYRVIYRVKDNSTADLNDCMSVVLDALLAWQMHNVLRYRNFMPISHNF